MYVSCIDSDDIGDRSIVFMFLCSMITSGHNKNILQLQCVCIMYYVDIIDYVIKEMCFCIWHCIGVIIWTQNYDFGPYICTGYRGMGN